jgi:hypothetical protein
MKRRSLIIILLTFFAVAFISVNAKASMTIATFADPSRNSSNSLFTVDFTLMQITGGWGDDKTGLTLRIPYSGHTFTDAWFKMDVVHITSASAMSGQIGAGVINFYANGTSVAPLLIVNFAGGTVSRYGFGADERLITNNVTITGSEIAGTLSEEEFSFSFANLAKLSGHTNWNDGFTTTAAFTSSAVPEPATICILGLGVLSLVRRKESAEKERSEEMWSALCAPQGGLKKTIGRRGEDV